MHHLRPCILSRVGGGLSGRTGGETSPHASRADCVTEFGALCLVVKASLFGSVFDLKMLRVKQLFLEHV